MMHRCFVFCSCKISTREEPYMIQSTPTYPYWSFWSACTDHSLHLDSRKGQFVVRDIHSVDRFSRIAHDKPQHVRLQAV